MSSQHSPVGTSSPLNHDSHLGSYMVIPKPKSTFRLLTQNVNGFPGHLTTMDKYASMLYVLHHFHIDVACCQEHNLDTTKYSIRQAIYQVNATLQMHPSPQVNFFLQHCRYYHLL